MTDSPTIDPSATDSRPDSEATAADGAGVARRLEEIRRRIAAACQRVGRDPAEVTLVGASKSQPLERLVAAACAGLVVFGENRVQEAEEHRAALEAALGAEAAARLRWHLIGPLQSNKAKLAAQLFDAVESVDRGKIARALERELAARERRVPAWLEVNLGGEVSKHGFPAAGLAEAVRPLAALEHLRVGGLMVIPPPGETPEDSRPWFRRARALRDELAALPEWRGRLTGLSMGMSDDFEVAVEEGATHVRVGSALFGPRRAVPTGD
ncbi:MAG TPA: YggS family pyridoxal phosphate-dependent enzyme [Thermoanaerobaculia bacterium]|nr:YggS family pyridoxal phosphate-dependent enzyme [Thermoanaerobaculia bacterium]